MHYIAVFSSNKSVVCTTSNVYVFDLYNYDEGPLLKANAPLKGKTPIGVLNLSTPDNPDLFGVSYLDTTYITLVLAFLMANNGFFIGF